MTPSFGLFLWALVIITPANAGLEGFRQWEQAAAETADEVVYRTHKSNYDVLAGKLLESAVPLWTEYRDGAVSEDAFLGMMHDLLARGRFPLKHVDHPVWLEGYAPPLFASLMSSLRQELLQHMPLARSAMAAPGPYRRPGEVVEPPHSSHGSYAALSSEDKVGLHLTMARFMVLLEEQQRPGFKAYGSADESQGRIAALRKAQIAEEWGVRDTPIQMSVAGFFVGAMGSAGIIALVNEFLMHSEAGGSALVGVAASAVGGVFLARDLLRRTMGRRFDRNRLEAQKAWAEQLRRRATLAESILTRREGLPPELAEEITALVVGGAGGVAALEAQAQELCATALKPTGVRVEAQDEEVEIAGAATDSRRRQR